MLGLSWAETFVILIVALIVIGPKDLPPLIRGAKQLIDKLKHLQRDITASFNEALKESGLEEATRDIEQDTKALNQDIRYIVDMEGNMQPTYDLSDLQREMEKPDIIKGSEPHE